MIFFARKDVFLHEVFRKCKVTGFLFVKLFLCIKPIHYKLIMIEFNISWVLKFSSWWQQLLGKIYDFHRQNKVILSESFAFRKSKNSRQRVLFVPRSTIEN